ncbi:cytochrome P450 81E8-like protein [Carex littledalei]|uniref:Cytochrome P450 81E8-like protein n=1 Tax=Carex littledalei TaxID=544730 RepID=A0A833QBP0_9POAL|nr:cytochrome P450 81E8-like protein [Carex littledalei]
MPSLDLVLQSILLSTAILVFVILSYYTNKLRKLPPSPPALPFIGHLYLFKKPLHHALARISQRYGPITFLHFGSWPILVISSPSLAEECLTTHDLAFANRPLLISDRLISGDGEVVEIGRANYGPYWRSVRKIATGELLSPQKIHASTDVRAREIDSMARQLFKSWKTCCFGSNGLNGVKLELKTCIFQLSLNVMMTMIAGKRFYEDNIKDMEDTKLFREALEEQLALGGASNIEDYLPAVLRWVDLNGAIRKKMHAVIKAADRDGPKPLLLFHEIQN